MQKYLKNRNCLSWSIQCRNKKNDHRENSPFEDIQKTAFENRVNFYNKFVFVEMEC